MILAHVKTTVMLAEGTRVLVDLPGHGDHGSYMFYQQYNGRTGTVVACGAEHAQVLDKHGRLPGRYMNPEWLVVAFNDGSRKTISAKWLRLLDAPVALAAEGEQAVWTRLPSVYPGDLVSFTTERFPQSPPEYLFPLSEAFAAAIDRSAEKGGLRIIDQVHLDEFGFYAGWRDAQGCHFVHEGDVQVVQAGPVQAAYTGKLIEFADVDDLLAFWEHDGFSVRVERPAPAGLDPLFAEIFYEAERCLDPQAQVPYSQYEADIDVIRSGQADFVRIHEEVLPSLGRTARHSSARKLHTWVGAEVAKQLREASLTLLQAHIAST